MAARRAPREGSIFQTKNGRWAVMIELPRKPGGKRNRVMRRARTRADAQRILKDLQAELHLSGSVADDRRTIADAVTSYETVRAGQQLSESTLRSDRWMLNLILDGLGHRRLSQLTVVECDRFLESCANGLTDDRRPIGRSQLKRVRSTFVAVLRNEMRLGTTARNVAQLSALPSMDAYEAGRRSLSVDELARLTEGATGAVAVLIDLIGWNGLRPAEARAVRWSDLDTRSGLLSVRAQLDSFDQDTAAKTKTSVRTIRLDETSLSRLESWKEEQADLRCYAGQAWTERDLIVTTTRGTAINRNNLIRSLHRLCKQLNIEPAISPYELRHTAISLQADAGQSSWEIADWAGTSERMISDVYRHRLSGVARLRPSR